MTSPEIGSVWKHRVTGSTWEVLGDGVVRCLDQGTNEMWGVGSVYDSSDYRQSYPSLYRSPQSWIMLYDSFTYWAMKTRGEHIETGTAL